MSNTARLHLVVLCCNNDSVQLLSIIIGAKFSTTSFIGRSFILKENNAFSPVKVLPSGCVTMHCMFVLNSFFGLCAHSTENTFYCN